MTVRTRFAPSPTGFLHAGGVRTALFAWIFARQQQGQFILRIEDTDKKREAEGSAQHIKDSLEWLGLKWDEDYLQSERLELYKQHAQMLIDKGLAYVDTYTPAQVEDFRNQAKAGGKVFLFREHRPQDAPVPQDWFGRLPLRFKTPEIKRFSWYDEVRGELSAGEEALDDFVLVKADGFPTYNFAHVVDDQLMQITHVMRGEEFIASVPKFLSLMDAFGWQYPKFVTLPPVLNPEGGKKLSKRDGAKDALEYRDAAYLPSAVFNFLASLGWNDGTDQEVYTPEEIIQKFSLDRIQKSGAKFDEMRLDWLNWQHFIKLVSSDLPGALSHARLTSDMDQGYLVSAAHLAVAKSASVEDFKLQMGIFTAEPKIDLVQIAPAVELTLNPEQAQHYITEAVNSLSGLDNWSSAAIEPALRSSMQKLGVEGRVFLNLIRWVVSGQKVSPSLFDMLEVLGKERVLSRLNTPLK